MKIRVEGLPSELDAAVDRLRRIFQIQSVSRPYKNRNSELRRVYVEAELGEGCWDEDCSTCAHDAECAETGGRQEGRGYGAACHPSLGETPHYERRQGAPDLELTPSPHGRDCLGNGEHPGIECCCDECSFQLICFPDHRELM